jgi:uncharacterized protein (DUF1786 family)
MKRDNYKSILKVLSELHTDYPTYNMDRHTTLALADYGNRGDISDKEFLFALRKYKAELELDITPITEDSYVDAIIKDGLDLDHILDEEEDYE